MAANSPENALDDFLVRVRGTTACVTDQPIVATGYRPSREPHSISFVPRDRPVQLHARSLHRTLLLLAAANYSVVPSRHDPTSFNIRIVGYQYRILDDQNREILAFHWHPSDLSHVIHPHVHLSSRLSPLQIGRGLDTLALGDLHIPTGLIHLEDVIRFLIAELGVEARMPDWPRVIAENRNPSLFPL